MVCTWPCLAALDSTTSVPECSFAQALSSSCDFPIPQLPPKIVMGKSVRVKINQREYEFGIEDCKTNLHGRLTLKKGDPPLTSKALKTKLDGLWPLLRNWSITPLGKGFYEFKFQCVEDMRKF